MATRLTKCATAMLVLLAGCGVTVRETPFPRSAHPPRGADHPIRMFSAKAPECPYEELGLLRAEPKSGLTPWARVVEGFVARARSMGGDGVILQQTSELRSDVDGELTTESVLAGSVIRFEGPCADAAASAAEAVVQAQLVAYNRRDVDAFVDSYAEDVRIYDHPDRLRISGRARLREEYAGFFAETPDLHAAVPNRIVQGEYVIDHETVTGLPNGASIQAVAIYQVRDGKIQNVWFLR